MGHGHATVPRDPANWVLFQIVATDTPRVRTLDKHVADARRIYDEPSLRLMVGSSTRILYTVTVARLIQALSLDIDAS
ncbi:hypothetical protein CC2G_003256 [Coprinopsis cinerea AmutBmut pab1-1]|nr:hypothetical protein CC2G_003256 [Coprinopsis cinerea AmutBmut pab1-1]